MSVWTYEQHRTRQQKIELKALIALAKFGHTFQVDKALAKLQKIAFPEDEAKKVYHNQEQTLDKYNEDF